MDQEIRLEFEKLHGRINDVKDRVTVLETQTPFTNAALVRIEGSVEKVITKMDRVKWAFYAPIIVLLVGAGWKLLTSGALEKL